MPAALRLSFSIPDVLSLTSIRAGETKLGQTMPLAMATDWAGSIRESTALFVWLGLAEDLGVRANLGIGGAQTAPEAALKALANVQQTPGLMGQDLLVGGLLQASLPDEAPMEDLRRTVEEIDSWVAEKIAVIVASGKIPIVVGGGHNNCYGLLKGAAPALGKPLAAINLDAHSDYRRKEGRHSGNGFRYAHEEGFLKRYVALGLHRNYNASDIVAEMEAHPDLLPMFYEDIFLQVAASGFEKALEEAFRFAAGHPVGIELDLDCIENLLSSALTPSGISMREARQYVCRAARDTQAVYLHLPEGVVSRSDGLQGATTGKALAYLITDFIREHRRRAIGL